MGVEIFRSLAEARGHFGPCATTIGVFDGVHIGHRRLIAEAVQTACERRLTPAVITFHPHPTAVVAPERVPLLLCTLEHRLQLLSEAGAEKIFVLPFTTDIARLTPEEFVKDILVDALDVKAVLVGTNFNFGYRQAGNTETLASLGRRHDFSTSFLDPVRYRGRIVSSSAVRSDIKLGRVERAARLLGRCFAMNGVVVRGRGIGSRETVPTLNLKPSPELAVPSGIYVTETIERTTDRRWPSVTSCGNNITFGATDFTVETFLLSSLDPPNPVDIEVRFLHYLRPEKAYPDAAALKIQILRDVAQSEAYWRRVGRFTRLPSVGNPSVY